METNFFDINSVAIIGASEAKGKIGNDLLLNLKNFKGEKFGVNPKGGSFGDIKFYKSVTELPSTPDIAVIVIPARFVLTSLKECGEKGIKRVIIISAGFKETGNIDGENEIKNLAKKYDIKILGPNCLGYIDAQKDLNLSFGGSDISKGNIAMISQSGAMAVALTDWANSTHLGFSKLISMGNKADIDENYLLENLADDEETDVIAIYLESIESGRKLFEITKKLTKKKPIVLIKSGLSERGKEAASSHTGALSGENKVLEVAFRDSGIHITSSLEDFFIWAEIFSKTIKQKVPESLAIITNAGGPGVMATDHCELNNIDLINFSENEQLLLKQSMPDASSMNNPIDIIGDATSARYKQILENMLLLNKNVGLLVLITPQTVTDVDVIAEEIHKWELRNPGYFMMTSFMGGLTVRPARRFLRKNKILAYDYPRKGLISYSQLLKQQKWEQLENQEDAKLFKGDSDKISEIKDKLKNEDKLCGPNTTNQLLKSFDIPFAEDKLITDPSQIKEVWNSKKQDKLVAKISSKDIAHKTDCGGVIVGISSLEEAEKAYYKILEDVKKAHPKANISGVTFQEMIPPSKEIFIGMKRDQSFGEVLIIGMGGIFVNIYEDVSMKLAPVNKNEIEIMIKELTGYPILNGARGEVVINFESLIDVVNKIQSLFHTYEEITEIDINPCFSNEKSSIIVDAKFYI